MREPYEIKLAHGGVFRLAYTFKAIRWMEKQTGGHFFSDTVRNLGTEYLAAGIAAGLLQSQPSITVAQVENIIEKHLEAGGHLPYLTDELIEAFKRAGVLKRPEGEAEPATERPTPAAAPGEQ